MDELGVEYEREKIWLYNEGARFILLDFWIESASLAVELDGDIHKTQRQYDEGRDKYLRSAGINILRFGNEAVLKTPGAVAEKVRREVENV